MPGHNSGALCYKRSQALRTTPILMIVERCWRMRSWMTAQSEHSKGIRKSACFCLRNPLAKCPAMAAFEVCQFGCSACPESAFDCIVCEAPIVTALDVTAQMACRKAFQGPEGATAATHVLELFSPDDEVRRKARRRRRRVG